MRGKALPIPKEMIGERVGHIMITNPFDRVTVSVPLYVRDGVQGPKLSAESHAGTPDVPRSIRIVLDAALRLSNKTGKRSGEVTHDGVAYEWCMLVF